MFSRFRSVARILVKGELKKKQRNPIPSITLEEVAEIKQFFPREKFFIFGHARSGTTLLMRLARLHPEVYCDYQAHFFTRPTFVEIAGGFSRHRRMADAQIELLESRTRSFTARTAIRRRLHHGA